MPSTSEALQRLLVALLVGLLIGLDRERAEVRKQRRQFAGVRTFPLIALLACGLTLVQAQTGLAVLVVAFVAFAALTVVSYFRTSADGQVGATTEVAALATFALGVIAGTGHLVTAGAIGVTVAVLLVAKPPLERFSRALSEAEIAAVLELAVISAIVLPLLPDEGYGPWEALNPFRIWMVVVLVSGVSFAGFIASRWKGQNAGLFLTAALGALVSSTAVTMAMAERSRDESVSARAAASAAVMASTVMCIRVFFLVAAVAPGILLGLLPPVGAMALAGAAAALLLRGGAPQGTASESQPLDNPFRLRAALLFGVLFAVVLLVLRGAQAVWGRSGLWLAALLSGLVDVDAISIAAARGAPASGEGVHQAQIAIVIACASNSVFKAGIAIVAGKGAFRLHVAWALAAMVGAAALGLALGFGLLG